MIGELAAKGFKAPVIGELGAEGSLRGLRRL